MDKRSPDYATIHENNVIGWEDTARMAGQFKKIASAICVPIVAAALLHVAVPAALLYGAVGLATGLWGIEVISATGAYLSDRNARTLNPRYAGFNPEGGGILPRLPIRLPPGLDLVAAGLQKLRIIPRHAFN